jgi:hypothetical protein
LLAFAVGSALLQTTQLPARALAAAFSARREITAAIPVRPQHGHLNHNAVNKVIELSDSQLHDQQPGRIEAGTIEQTTRIETVAAQLEKWRNELVQERRQCVSNHI